MAIEIIPKKKIRKWIEISPFEILYYLVIILLLVVFLSYFGFDILINSSQQELAELEASISQKESKEVQMLEERVLQSKEKIDTFAALLGAHKKSSNFFSFLKQNCHQEIFFSKVDLNVEESEVSMSGKAESFGTLGEQILIFKTQDFVEGLVLHRISMGKEGGIEFGLSLSLNPEIFK